MRNRLYVGRLFNQAQAVHFRRRHRDGRFLPSLSGAALKAAREAIRAIQAHRLLDVIFQPRQRDCSHAPMPGAEAWGAVSQGIHLTPFRRNWASKWRRNFSATPSALFKVSSN